VIALKNIGFIENLAIEFKSDLNCLSDSDIIDAVVAFANTDGGELYLGVEDSGEITGIHDKHKDITKLSAYIANKTVPPVAVRVEILEMDKPILKIVVPKMTCIVASSVGKIQRRRIKADGTPENVPMYPYEISSRLSSLNMLDYSAQAVPDSEYSDLDPVERERLRNIIRTYRGEISLLELNDEELDKALRFVTSSEGKLVPTFCGLLLIGRKEALLRYMPTAESSIQVLCGTDVKVNETFILPILSAFEKINEIFLAWNNSEEMDMGLYRLTIPDYDTKAFREALVNAFCHRDYSVMGRVLIQITDTGMTISNPGGFVEGISVDNLIDADPHGRNPVLADSMKRIGLAERTGRGIDRIYEGSLFYGRQMPDYSQSSARKVILFISKGPTDKEFIRMISAEQQRMGRNFPIYSLLILNLLKDTPKLKVRQIAEELRIPESRIRVSLEALVSSGIAEAVGSGRGRCYMLSSRCYKKTQKTVEYIRQKNIDPIRHEELVMELLKKKGDICRADVIELLRVTPSQAYRILFKLADSGKIQKEGAGAGAKYIIKK
jgi:ATP-dependent DNA helicase RecG